MITYHQGDERPAWQPQITVDGLSEDYTTGHEFQVEVSQSSTVLFTKTTGITGINGGVVVDWATTGELSELDPGLYSASLRIRRTSDSKDITIKTRIKILP